jgi:hypothetical protein
VPLAFTSHRSTRCAGDRHLHTAVAHSRHDSTGRLLTDNCILDTPRSAVSLLRRNACLEATTEGKLATDQEWRIRSVEDGATNSDTEDQDHNTAVPSLKSSQATPDKLDWPAEHSLILPISSQSKSRHALLHILAPSIAFLATQPQLGRLMVIVCEDGEDARTTPCAPE